MNFAVRLSRRIVITFAIASALFSIAQAQTSADSVTFTFRAVKPSSPTIFVPGQFNNWGPNSSGVISAGAASQMSYNSGIGAWTKSYTFKIHDGSDTRRTLADSIFQYKFNQGGTASGWYTDPLNPEKNSSDNNNSILRLTKTFWFEVYLVEASSQYNHISAGLGWQNSAFISSVVLQYGPDQASATTATVTSSLNTSTHLFDYDLPAPIPKSYFVRLVAYTTNGDSAVYYNAGLNIVTMAVPGYAVQAVTLPSVSSNDSTTFVVRAPGREYVKIRIAPVGTSPSTVAGVLMRKGTDSYTWWLNMKLDPGTYEYLYEMPDGTLLYDPWGMYNGTNGSRFTVGAAGLTADNYSWQHTDFVRPPLNKLVIYEMNLNEVVGGYTGKAPGNCRFTDLIPLLPYYDSLGINAIELMPINDYGVVGPSGFSWGYDLNTDFALEPSFGTPADFKALVDAAHGRGISIIIDVVYNHLNDTGPLWQISPSLSTNPYFHTAGTNYNEDGTSLFKDMNHWAPETQEYIYGALKMWLDRYKVDGFRFDFTRGIGWNVNEPTKGILGWANRIDTEYNHQVYLIAEHLPESPTLIHVSGLTGGWHDAFHDELFTEAGSRSTSLDNFENYILGLLAYNSVETPATQSSYDDRTNPVNMTVDHDEQSLIYEMTQFHGVSSADAVKRDKLYGTFMFTSLGIPFLWEGMEHAEPRGWPDGNTRLSYRPVQWSLGNQTTGQTHFQYYKTLINLRKTNPALYQGNLRKLWKYYSQKALVWGFEDPSSSSKVMIVANLNSTDQTITNVPWLAAGTWYDAFNNTPFEAGGTSIPSMTIPAFTAKVYTNDAPADPPTLELNLSDLNFGDVMIAGTASQGFSIHNGGASTLNVSIQSTNPRFSVKTSAFSMAPGGTVNDTARFSPVSAGAASGLIILTSNTVKNLDTITVSGNCILPVVDAPVLATPEDESTDQPQLLTLRWHHVSSALRYELQLSTDSTFSAGVDDDSTLTDTLAGKTLSASTRYFWRVAAIGQYSRSDWSLTYAFNTTETPFSVQGTLMAKWNMVSLPVVASDPHKTVLFPHATSQAYAYTGSYTTSDLLVPGTGYWLKSDSARTVTFIGAPIVEDSIAVTAGWNMIGSLSVPVAAASITSSPSGMITSALYRYAASYLTADSIRPGGGYWIKVNQGGKLYLSAGGPKAKPGTVHIVRTSELPPSPPEADASAPVVIPAQFSLGQNYPNPFNPSTTIRYALAQPEQVTLAVYDMLGRIVGELVNEVQPAGEHAIQWNAGDVPSGVYYYRLTTPTQHAFGRMTLVR